MKRLAAIAATFLLGSLAAAAHAQTESKAIYRVGDVISVDPQNLPKPGETPTASNRPDLVERQGRGLKVPAGFQAHLYAEGLRNPRMMLPLPDGSVLVSEPRAGQITHLQDRNGDGRADEARPYLENLSRPHGMALHQGHLYIGEAGQVRRVRVGPDFSVQGGLQEVTAPQSLGGGGGFHVTRNILFAPDGQSFLVPVGSRGNVGTEPEPYATIQAFNAQGQNQRTFASGIRNAIGIRRHPQTGAVWVVVNERDGYGDGLVPDYMTRVQDGDFYGWPWAYIGKNPDPTYGARARTGGRVQSAGFLV